MPIRYIQNNFNSGELSPRLHARDDIERYRSGVKTMKNWIPLVQGGAKTTYGTRFVHEVKDSSKQTYVLPFEFSETQAYVIEFGEYYFRFYRDGALIHEDSVTISNAVDNGSGLIRLTATGHGLDAFAPTAVFHVDVSANPDTFVDETVDAGDAGDADVDLMPAVEGSGDYAAFGYKERFTKLTFDNANGTAGIGGTVAWEYWNGTAWTALSGLVDGTSGFTAAVADGQDVTWTKPTDWVPLELNGVLAYYVRARVTGTYSTNPVYDQIFVKDVDLWVTVSGVLGTTEANGHWQITVVDANTIDLVGSTFTNAYDSAGTVARTVDLPHPYAQADLSDVKHTQDADTLYLAHKSHKPRKLTRSSHVAWTLSVIDFLDGPYLDENSTETTLDPSAATGNGITVLANSTVGINGGQGFLATDVGRLIRFKDGSSDWGYMKITGITDNTTVIADVINTLTTHIASKQWRLGAWSDTTGYPAAITIFEQRLFYARSDNNPQSVWGSTSGSYEDFTPSAGDGTVADADAVTYTLGSNKVNVIKWLVGADRMHIGTTGEEFGLDGGGEGSSVTPSNVRVRAGSTEGTNAVQAIRTTDGTVYMKRSGRKCLALAYDFNKDALNSKELSVFAEHLFRTDDAQRMAYQQDPDRIVWVVMSDGDASVLVSQPEHGVLAWATRVTDGSFEDVTVIPSLDGSQDDAYFIVNRTIQSATKRYIEVTDPRIHVDSGVYHNTVVSNATITATGTAGEPVPDGSPVLAANMLIHHDGNLGVWKDVSRTLAAGDGDPIRAWDDQSGNAHHALMVDTDPERPIYKTNIVNGHAVIRFDGVDDFLQSTAAVRDAIATNNVTVFTVQKIDSAPTTSFGFVLAQLFSSPGPTTWGLRADYDDDDRTLRYIKTGVGGVKTFGAYNRETFEMWMARVDDATIDLKYWHTNRGTVTDSNTAGGTVHATFPQIGRRFGGDGVTKLEFLDGDIAEIVLYARTLTKQDMNNTILYLMDKYNITVSGEGELFTSDVAIFTKQDVGKDILVKGFLKNDGTFSWGRATITTFIDPKNVFGIVKATFPPPSEPVAASFWYKALSIVDGLDHLEGKTVDIVGDDAVYPQQVVSGGQVDLSGVQAAGELYVGLPRTATMILLPPSIAGSNRGSIRGKIKRWINAALYLTNSLGLKINGSRMHYRKPTDQMDLAVPFFTGDKLLSLQDLVSRQGEVTIEQDLPLFAEVNTFYGELDVED